MSAATIIKEVVMNDGNLIDDIERELSRGVVKNDHPIVEGAGPHIAGGDGESLATAFRIVGAAGSPDGVAVEYAYIEQRFGSEGIGHEFVEQHLMQDGGRTFDVITIQLPNGERMDIHFDITGFFGRW